MSFRFAICNEIFQGAPLEEICNAAKRHGYDGIELAPHTLAEDATKLSATERSEVRAKILDAGLEFVGLHWLLVSPPGLHVTSGDESVRSASWEYVRRSIDLCADLGQANSGHKGVIVFGSPKQRSARDGVSAEAAVRIFRDQLEQLASKAEDAEVTVLVEAIPSSDTNVVNTLEQAVSLVEQIGSPAVQTMFDVHNAADESASHDELIRRFSSYIKHIHVNETDGREPGMGSYDFPRLLKTLDEAEYTGWISVEAFDFTRPSDEIARRAIQCLEEARSLS